MSLIIRRLSATLLCVAFFISLSLAASLKDTANLNKDSSPLGSFSPLDSSTCGVDDTASSPLLPHINSPLLNQSKQKDAHTLNAKPSISQTQKDQRSKNLKVGDLELSKQQKKTFELLGENITREGDNIIASEDASVMNTELYALADKITYNTETKFVRLQGNVKIYKNDQLYLQANQATFYLNSDFVIIEPFYVQENSTGIWMSAKAAASNRNVFRFNSSIVSSCSVVSPAWRIDTSSGSFNKDKSIVQLWNARIYIGDVPIMYLPYMRLSTENKRTSGFLYPTTGSSSTEGFVYLQPYYLALQDFWDMTFTPQVRTNRGGGLNYEFRATSPYHDNLILNARYFYNTPEYVRNLNLVNSQIYGFDVKTSARNFMQKYLGLKSSIDNGLYVDFAYMNDLDYMRLDRFNYFLNTSSYTSRVNLYTQLGDNYFGANFKYFLNFNIADNRTTLQNLPNLQYHKYLSSLFFKELLYSIDYQLKNTYRPIGYSYVSNELSIPLGMNFSIFNKFLSLGIWANVYAGNIYAGNIFGNNKMPLYTFNTLDNSEFVLDPATNRYGNYLAANYRISLNLDIGRDYNKFFHALQASFNLSAPFANSVFTNGLLSKQVLQTYSLLGTNELQAIQNRFDIWDPSSFTSVFAGNTRIDLNLSNYFYNLNGQELFYWRASQILNLDDTISPVRTPMENKLGTSPISGLNLSTSFFYSFFYNAFTELALNANYSNKRVNAGISYYLKRDTAFAIDNLTLTRTITDASNFLRLNFGGDLGYFGVDGFISYDFRTNTILNLGVGIHKDIKCFGVAIKAGSDRTPILTNVTNDGNSQISVIQNTYVKFEIKFVPLTSVGYVYRLRPRIN
ncbi:LPS assembly protein LptD [Helicobacter sp. 11S02629-2]|uniref:LPS-assembly protein LptD n=1 Tax=Helicobacter sp. 11S02629-2 TaxID=1476195 RepID=UPI002151BD62|nr:LPS assembly protein LptD [Helicobacter sp. 11S02629-2]